MNRINDPISERLSIVIENDEDKRACSRALGPISIDYEKKLAVDRLASPTLIEAEVTEAVARGLAEISLGQYGPRGFSGLSQEEADRRLCDISGDVTDFFRLILLPDTIDN